jgi:c-di-GMP-binding flagellar brake protein YcgR
MAKGSQLGDRRRHPRFESAGQVWAALTLRTRGVLRDISADGALVETELTEGLESAGAMQVSLRAGGPEVRVVARHRAVVPSTADQERCRVGLEFVHVSPAGRIEVEQLVYESNEESES